MKKKISIGSISIQNRNEESRIGVSRQFRLPVIKKIVIQCVFPVFWIFVLSFCVTKNDIYAEDRELFHIADSLKLIGQYDFAAIEYERAYFNSTEVDLQCSALLQKAECLKALEKFKIAENCLLRINYFGLSDSLVFSARYQTALCAYLAEHFSTAESQLIQLNSQVKDSILRWQSLPLFTLVLNELQKWEEAKSTILKYIENVELQRKNQKNLINTFESLYNPENQPKLKKPGTAKILSSIIPGSGQIYAGYFWEGVANAAMQGASLLLTAYGIYTGYYITSVVIWFGLFQKFYSGAIMRTEYLVEKKNYELARAYNDLLKKEIISLQNLP